MQQRSLLVLHLALAAQSRLLFLGKAIGTWRFGGFFLLDWVGYSGARVCDAPIGSAITRIASMFASNISA
jgi:hypothetical protein